MHRSGFTLIEMLVVVVLLGIVALLGAPKLRQSMIANDVRGARTTVVNQYALARSTAIQNGQWARLKIANSDQVSVEVEVTPGTWNTVGGVYDLGDMYHVTVTASHSTIDVDPRGITNLGDEGATIQVTRDGNSDTVTITNFGRVQP